MLEYKSKDYVEYYIGRKLTHSFYILIIYYA